MSSARLPLPPRTIAGFGAGPMLEPLPKPLIDLLIGSPGIGSSQILPHERQAHLKQVERRPKVVAGGSRTRPHAQDCSASLGLAPGHGPDWRDTYSLESVEINARIPTGVPQRVASAWGPKPSISSHMKQYLAPRA